VGRLLEICKGIAIEPERRDLYLQRWDALENGRNWKPPKKAKKKNRKAKNVRLHGVGPQNPAPHPMRGRCKSLGDHLRSEKGDLCGCKKPQDIYECEVHGQCSLKRSFKKIKSCGSCPDHTLSEYQKNLIMVIYPVAGLRGWKDNVDIIASHQQLFDGKRTIAIFEPSGKDKHELDSAEEVQDRFGDGFEFIRIKNNPRLREVNAFVPLMESVKKEPGVTFFCHAKGCTHQQNDGVTPHIWRDLMYAALLDWGAVHPWLSKYPVVGSLKKYSRLGKSSWHYSGTFYWFRNDIVFSNEDWRDIEPRWWGAESWPGKIFGSEEAGCVFGDGVGTLYHKTEMDRWVGEARTRGIME
jgi:hypothetical protein